MSFSSDVTQRAALWQTQADLLQQLILEVRAMKTALIALDKNMQPRDCEGPSYSDHTTSGVSIP